MGYVGGWSCLVLRPFILPTLWLAREVGVGRCRDGGISTVTAVCVTFESFLIAGLMEMFSPRLRPASPFRSYFNNDLNNNKELTMCLLFRHLNLRRYLYSK